MYAHATIQLRERGYVGSVEDVWDHYVTISGGGTTGTIDDKTYNWLGYKGYTQNTLMDRWMAYLRDEGLTGAIQDMIRKWEVPEAGTGPNPGEPYEDPLSEFVRFFWNGEEGVVEHISQKNGLLRGSAVADYDGGVWGGKCFNSAPASSQVSDCLQYSEMDLNIQGSYTIDMWGRNIVDGPSPYPTVLGLDSTYVGVSESRGFTWGAHDGGAFLRSSSAIPRDVWTHVAWVNDVENNKRTIYVNGKNFVSSNTSASQLVSTVISLGNRSGSSSYPYYGRLDEVRITAAARWTEEFDPPAGPAIIV